jgi:hypothetical protein
MTLAVLNLIVLIAWLAAELVPSLANAAADRELELARQQADDRGEAGEKRP